MPVSSRSELASYIRRRLGAGNNALTVNVTDDQITDRIDDALQMYRDYHYDATEKVYLKEQLTSSVFTLDAPSTGTFSNNETVIGATTNAHGIIHHQANTTTVRFTTANWVFSNAEVITGQRSGATGTVSAIANGNIDNRYLVIANNMVGVTRIFPSDEGLITAPGMFSVQYQMAMSEMWGLSSVSLTNYYMARQHLELIQQLLVGKIGIRYSRHQNRLHLDWDWKVDAIPGKYVIVEGYRVLDPDAYPDVWDDRWLKAYATALVKKQWGQNMMKFQGTNMVGGLQLNGEKIYEEGKEEAEKLETELQNKYELPPEFFIG
jgi:hypothetical protein